MFRVVTVWAYSIDQMSKNNIKRLNGKVCHAMHAAVFIVYYELCIDMHHGHFSKKNKDRTHVRTGTYSWSLYPLVEVSVCDMMWPFYFWRRFCRLHRACARCCAQINCKRTRWTRRAKTTREQQDINKSQKPTDEYHHVVHVPVPV